MSPQHNKLPATATGSATANQTSQLGASPSMLIRSIANMFWGLLMGLVMPPERHTQSTMLDVTRGLQLQSALRPSPLHPSLQPDMLAQAKRVPNNAPRLLASAIPITRDLLKACPAGQAARRARFANNGAQRMRGLCKPAALKMLPHLPRLRVDRDSSTLLRWPPCSTHPEAAFSE
jgi:hypothetical protein